MKRWIVLAQLLIIAVGFSQTAVDTVHDMLMWVETTQKDFADGTFEHNIYCTYRPFIDSLPGNIEFVQRFDFNLDGWADFGESNVAQYSEGPYRESVFVYLQYPGGGFVRAGEYYKRLSYPTGAAGDLLGADLNIDGFPELIIQNFWYYPYAPGYNRGGVSIFWGDSSTGCPDPTSWDSIGPHSGSGTCGGVYVADLNKDGYLDIIAGIYPDVKDFSIFWGSDTGYRSDVRTTIRIPLEYAHPTHNFEVADFDKDGYYDILVTCFVFWDQTPPVDVKPAWLIYWGDSTGYSEDNYTKFSVDDVQAHGATVADLNNDGWLDIVCTTYKSGLKAVYFDTSEAVIYYGMGNRQFSKDSTVLHPNYCFGGSVAADLLPRGNPDGWLDLVFFVGNIDEVGTTNPYKSYLWLYQGGPDGFSDSLREPLEAVGARKWSTSGGIVADFNCDGYPDIGINDWVTLNGKSGVLWGPDFSTIDEFENHTDHHGFPWELGNTYNRKYYEDYISSVYDAGMEVNWDGVFVIDSCPPGTDIKVAIRTGNTPVPDESWSGWYTMPITPSKDNGWLAGAVPDSLNSRYIQYKATFSYTNPAYFPVLFEIRITYPPGIRVDPDRVVYADPGDTVDFYRSPDPTDENEWVISYTTVQDTANITIGRYTRKDWGEPQLLRPGGTEPLTDHNGDGIPDLPGLPPCRMIDHKPVPTGSLPFWVRRIVPLTAHAGDVDTTIVWGRLVNHDMVKDSAILVTIVREKPGIVIEPDRIDTIFPGQSVYYHEWGSNLGNAIDTIDIKTFGTREGWGCELLSAEDSTIPLPDNDRDGIPDLGGLRPDGLDTIPFIVKITSPPDARHGDADTTFAWGYSSRDSLVEDNARLITVVVETTIVKVDTTIYLQISPPDSDYIYRKFTKYGYPESTTVNPYSLWIVNESYIDSVVISPEAPPCSVRMELTLPYVNLDTLRFLPSRVPLKGPWKVVYRDSLGNPLKDNDGDGMVDLMNVPPGTTKFQMMVVAPKGLGYIVGAIDSSNITADTIIARTDIKPVPGPEDITRDTTFIKTILVPPLDIHNFPNPFRKHFTTFVFSLPDDGYVTLKLFNRAGEHIKTLIKNEFYTMGVHTYPWYGKNEKGRDVGPGTYLYPFYFKAEGKYIPGKTLYTKGVTIIKKAMLLP